ncbi:hypothetical protein BSKO_12019 [Bryopsis sp. KO-2023]|nr:hypothetical protein BSKO_12019 [Bryopsis sp. KO-2023]
MSKKAEVIVVDVEKVPAEQGPAVAKRLDERRKSVGDGQTESATITLKLSAAEERREQAIKEKAEKVKLDTAEKKAKEALAAKQAGLTEYMKVLNLSSKGSTEEPKAEQKTEEKES